MEPTATRVNPAENYGNLAKFPQGKVFVADRIDSLIQQLAEKGLHDKVFELAVEISKLNKIVNEVFPLTSKGFSANPEIGNYGIIGMRERLRSDLYGQFFRPYEELLPQKNTEYSQNQ